MDLLGSILGTMQKPPTMGDEERKKAKGSLIFSVDVSRVVRICSNHSINDYEDLHIEMFQILFTSRI